MHQSKGSRASSIAADRQSAQESRQKKHTSKGCSTASQRRAGASRAKEWPNPDWSGPGLSLAFVIAEPKKQPEKMAVC